MRPRSTLPVIALAGLTTSLYADVFASRAAFESAYPGLATQDFEAAGDFQQDYVDFFLSSGAGGGTGVGTTDSNFPSRVAFSFFADDMINMDFGVPVTAVGFEVASIHFFDQTGEEVEITVYDSMDNVLAMEIFGTSGRAMTTFIGFSNLGAEIARVEIADGAGPEFVEIDTVSYGIPAPGTALLPALAGGLALRRRRR